MLVGFPAQDDIAVDDGQPQQPGDAPRRPGTVQRAFHGERTDGYALARIVPHVLVRRVVVDVGPGRHGEIRDGRTDHVPGTQEGRHLDGAHTVAHEVEAADEIRERGGGGDTLPALEQRQRHRRRGLVRIRLDRHPVAPRAGHGVALGVGVEHVRRGRVEESRHGVVQEQGHAGTQEVALVQVAQVTRLRVLHLEPSDRGRRTEVEGDIEGAVRGVEIAAHVEGRDALVGGDRVEPTGVGFRRQRLRERPRMLLVDAQQVGDRVQVFEPGQAAERRPLRTPRREVGLDQRRAEAAERRIDDRRIGRRHGRRRHVAPLDAVVHPLPGAEDRWIRQVMADRRQVEGAQHRVVVAADAAGLEEGPYRRLERACGTCVDEDRRHQSPGGQCPKAREALTSTRRHGPFPRIRWREILAACRSDRRWSDCVRAARMT